MLINKISQSIILVKHDIMADNLSIFIYESSKLKIYIL